MLLGSLGCGAHLLSVDVKMDAGSGIVQHLANHLGEVLLPSRHDCGQQYQCGQETADGAAMATGKTCKRGSDRCRKHRKQEVKGRGDAINSNGR